MRLERLSRDLLFGLIGAGIAMAMIEGFGDLGSHPAALEAIPPNETSELIAWTLRKRTVGIELLHEAPEAGITECQLAADGMLRPVLDENTRLPSRVGHWQADGPRLWVMWFERERSGGSAMKRPVAQQPEPCPEGRVLVPAETIMNFLYERSRQVNAASN